MVFFNGKVALVTGGASGIGLSIVQKLLENGIKSVAIVDITDENWKNVGTVLSAEYPNKIIFIKANVSNQQELEDAFEKTIHTLGNLDIVANNAGISDEDQWERNIAINLGGVIRGTYLARDKYFPKYKSGEEGIILNTASIAGLLRIESHPIYTAAKHGVVGLGKALGAQQSSKETRIITICPGFVRTPLTASADFELFTHNGLSANAMSSDFIAESVIKLLQEARNGSVWMIENWEPPFEVNFPGTSELREQSNNSL